MLLIHVLAHRVCGSFIVDNTLTLAINGDTAQCNVIDNIMTTNYYSKIKASMAGLMDVGNMKSIPRLPKPFNTASSLCVSL